MSVPRVHIIYSLNEPNSKVVRYIGQTCQKLINRYNAHLRESIKENRYVCNWVRSLIQRGLKPEIHIIDTADSIDEANQKEIAYIKLYKSLGAKLTNLSNGGGGQLGVKKSEETRKKLSEAHKGKHAGKKHFWYGKKHTPETKLKMSESAKGHKRMTDELKQRLRIVNTGKVISEETKEKLRAKRKLRIITPETKKAISVALTGKKHDAERILKNRIAQFGKKASPETRLKMTLAQSGSNGHKAIFTPEQVNEIRQLFQSGISQKELVMRYGVSKSTIRKLINRTTYRHQ